MSVNITKHIKPQRNTAILLDPERTKKELFDERRKQRLLQVRTKAKEVASQVRRNFNLENKKQLKRIEQINQQERKTSKQKQDCDDDIRFFEFGDAHRAAYLENKVNTFTPVNRSTIRITSEKNTTSDDQSNNEKTGNIDKENSSYNANIEESKHIYPNVNIKNSRAKNMLEEEQRNIFGKRKKPQHSIKKLNESLKTQQISVDGCCFLPICCCCHPILACQCHLNTKCNCLKKKSRSPKSESEEEVNLTKNESTQALSTTSTGTLSNETKFTSSYDNFKERQRQKSSKILTKTPSVIMEVSSEDSDTSFSSSCNVGDTHSNTNMHFSRIYSQTRNTNVKNLNKYNVKDFQATSDPSSESLDTLVPSKSSNKKSSKQDKLSILTPPKQSANISISRPPTRTRFTKISDLLKQKPIEQNISKNLPITLDKSTQMSFDKILHGNTEENIAKDFCTRGVLVDTKELSRNQLQNIENVEKINTESHAVQQVQIQNSVINNEKPKTSRKFSKNGIIGQKRKDSSQIGELLGPKSILGSKGSLPKQNLTEKVQYYDYNNRFQKQYHPKSNYIIQNDREVGSLNAVENANIEKQLQQTNDNQLELLRKKSDERCQEAIEREQVRLDYEAIQAKLDALTSDKKSGSNVSQLQDENIFSDIRLKQLATVRQNKINNAVESILQRPIVITCPEFNSNLPFNRNNNTNSDKQNGINLANNNNGENILNSSDSCGSILLNYVDKKAEEISNDIKISNNNEKNVKLQSLLNRLNTLRSDLLNELQSNNTLNQNSNIKNVTGAINKVITDNENIMTTNKKVNKLEKRENRLKKQEAILEKKVKEFFEMQKSSGKSIQTNDESESVDSIENNKSNSVEESTESSIYLKTKSISTKIANQPIEIIIKVNEKCKTNVKSPYRAPRQRASLIDPIVKRKKKSNIQKISTPIRLDNDEKRVIEREENSSQTTSTTTYKNLPNRIENNLNKFLDEHKQQEQQTQDFPEENKICSERPKKISTTKRVITTKKLAKPEIKSSKIVNKISNEAECLKPSHNVISQPISSCSNPAGKTINPILGHYIQRLLGMSRQSINMLGVSSSTMTTPNSSLVNASGNKSDSNDYSVDKDRVERLQRFVDDNYSFLSDLEESLKVDQSSSIISTSEASQRVIAEIWQKTLNREDCVKKTAKPILKKSSSKLKSITGTDNDNSKLDMLGKYTELAATGAQRIAELNEMINRVREEKQKILEITLSSNSDNDRNSTEYRDFVQKQTQQQSQRTYEHDIGPCGSKTIPQNTNNDNCEEAATCIDKISDGQIPPNIIRVPEIEICENTQLEKNKLTGISRDSGISLSRPVTALGSRDSPDTRRDSKPEDNLIFEPLLKNIPKPNAQNLLQNKTHIATGISDKIMKKSNKPPVALTRFSPQLIEEIPHELSTILEIDTPGTSRLNAFTKQLSTENVKTNEIILPSNENECEALLDDIRIDFKKFPTFEEYAKQHNLDLTNFDPELNLHMQKEYQKLLELTQSINEIEYTDYPSQFDYNSARNELKELFSITDNCDDQNNRIELLISEESLEKNKPKFKKFPTAKEYFKKFGAKDFINSSSQDNASIMTNDMKTSTDEKHISTSLCESLPDVNAELKRRNVIQHSFSNPYKNDEEKDDTSDDLNAISGSTGTENNKSKIKNDINLSEEIEKDLENMGLKWAQVMLQKTHRSQALSSSTESSRLFENHLRPSPFRKSVIDSFTGDKKLKSSTRIDMDQELSHSSNTSAISELGGKPLNLREFLSQELQKRTNCSTLSSSGTDDSMVNLFLRSLLGSITPSSGKQTLDRKQKTSTPVETSKTSKTQSSSIKNNSSSIDGTTKLFSGESRLSSVRFSRSDYEKSVDDSKNSNNKQKTSSFEDCNR